MEPVDRFIIGGIFIVASIFAYLSYKNLDLIFSLTGIMFLFALGAFYVLSGLFVVSKLRRRQQQKE